MIHQPLLLIGQAVSHQTLTPIKKVGGGLPRYRPETSFTFETGDIVYMY